MIFHGSFSAKGKRDLAALFVILLVLSGLTGCTRPSEIVEAPKYPDSLVAIHLADEIYRADAQRERVPKPIPLDTLRLEGAGKTSRTKARVIFAAQGAGTVLKYEQPIDSREYNELEIRMSVSAGTEAVVRWRVDAGGHELRMSNRVELLPGESRTYLIPLRDQTYPFLEPIIPAITIYPTDVEAVIYVESITLRYDPPRKPPQWTKSKQTYPIVSNSNISWPVTVPGHAVFQSGVAIAGAQGLQATVAYSVSFVETSGVSHVLAEGFADASDFSSVNVDADLSPYQGTKGLMQLTTQITASDGPAMPVWSNPRILGRRADPAKARPVILISIDTLRPDHLGMYGYAKPTSPVLDAFARESVRFTNAFTGRPFTPIAHMTMLTGRHAHHHQLTQTSNLPDDVTTLPQILSANGFTCGGFTGHSWWLLPNRGFGRGFDHYIVPDTEFRHIHKTLPLLTSWLGSVAGCDFFVFLHSYDTHSKSASEGYELPYDPGAPGFTQFADELSHRPPFAPSEQPDLKAAHVLSAANMDSITLTRGQVEYLVALYDDSIRMVDDSIGTLLAELGAQPWYEEALIIITSDHGEAFGEHGKYEHIEVYDNVLRVPLLVRFPHGEYAGRTVETVVGLEDIAPTITDVLGVQAPAMDGDSLKKFLQEPASRHSTVYASRGSLRAVRTHGWKLIEDSLTGDHELYCLEVDPEEFDNVSEQSPGRVEFMGAQVTEYFARSNEGWMISLYTNYLDVDVELSVSTAGRFAVVTTSDTESLAFPGMRNIDWLKTGLDGRSVDAKLQLPPHDVDRLLLLPAAGEQEIQLTLKSTRSAALYRGNDARVKRGTEFNLVLDPNRVGDHSQSAVPESSKAPLAVCVTYAAPEDFLMPAEEVGVEQIEALEALGYGG